MCQGVDSDDDDDDDDSSGMVVDAPNFHSNLNRKEVMVDEPRPSETAEAEDGWTVVAPRRNRGTRN